MWSEISSFLSLLTKMSFPNILVPLPIIVIDGGKRPHLPLWITDGGPVILQNCMTIFRELCGFAAIIHTGNTMYFGVSQ